MVRYRYRYRKKRSWGCGTVLIIFLLLGVLTSYWKWIVGIGILVAIIYFLCDVIALWGMPREINFNRENDIDSMDGHAFEYFCADILRQQGYIHVEATRGSGDQGVDILAERNGVRYAIQCKCYSGSVGNKAVQEIYSGMNFYGCDVGVVMTNNYFTPSAKELAEVHGILLWDRNDLMRYAQTDTEANYKRQGMLNSKSNNWMWWILAIVISVIFGVITELWEITLVAVVLIIAVYLMVIMAQRGLAADCQKKRSYKSKHGDIRRHLIDNRQESKNRISVEVRNTDTCNNNEIVRLNNDLGKYLFENIMEKSKDSIVEYLDNEEGNTKQNVLKGQIVEPVLFYVAKYHPQLNRINYIFYSKMDESFKETELYKRFFERDSVDSNIFEINVRYNLNDIRIRDMEIFFDKEPEINIALGTLKEITSNYEVRRITRESFINSDYFIMLRRNISFSTEEESG